MRTQTWTNGLLTSQSEPGKPPTGFAYDAFRRLERETDPLGNYAEYTYDANGNLQTRRDKRGFITTYQYDDAGRLIQRTDPLGRQATTSYVLGTHLIASATDEYGSGVQYTYDDRGLMTSANYPSTDGKPKKWLRDRAGNVMAEINSRGFATHYQLDALGRVLSQTDALGGQRFYVRDAAGQVMEERDELGGMTTYTRHVRGWVETATDPLGHTVIFGHDAAGNIISATDPMGRQTLTVHDALGRVESVTEAYGTLDARTSITAFNLDGTVDTETDVLGYVTEYGYDDAGQRTSMTQALGTLRERTFSYTLDEEGNIFEQTDPHGLVTRNTFDALGRLTQIVEGYGSGLTRTTTKEYPSYDRVVRVTDPLGNQASYWSDYWGRTTAMVDPSGSKSWWFDGEGNVFKTLESGGTGNNTLTRNAEYKLDANSRLIESKEWGLCSGAADVPRITQTVRDAAGNPVLVLVPAASGVLEQSFDAAGRMTKQKQLVSLMPTAVFREMNFGHDDAGNRTSATDPLGRATNFDYDALNRLKAVREPMGKNTLTDYDRAGREVRVTDPLGRKTEYVFDELGRQIEVKQAAGTPDQRSATTGYDLLDNVLQTTDALGRSATFVYDTLYRKFSATWLGRTTIFTTDLLGQVTESADWAGRKTSYEYDGFGHVKKLTKNSHLPPAQQTVSTWEYALDKVMAASDGVTSVLSWYRYNCWGQQTMASDSSGTTSLDYDGAGNLVRTVQGGPGGNETTYVYNLAGDRLRATDALGASTSFEYYGDGALKKITDRNGRVREFTRDDLNRVTLEEWKNSAGGTVVSTIASEYFLDGSIKKATNALGTLEYTYDSLNRTKTATDVYGITLTYTFDKIDRRTLVADSLGGSAATGYDGFGLLDTYTMTHPGLPSVAISRDYNSRDEMTLQTLGGAGLHTDYLNDAVGRMTHSDTWTADRRIELLEYSYSGGGSLSAGEKRDARMTASAPHWGVPVLGSNPPAFQAPSSGTSDTDGDFSYDHSLLYDSYAQVLNFGGSTFQYDALMNLKRQGVTIGVGNRLLEDTVWTYSYDGEGNLKGKVKKDGTATWSFQYDHLNRMIQATGSGTTTVWVVMGSLPVLVSQPWSESVSYGHDAAGRRVSRTSGGTTEKYAYDGDQLWADLDADGAVTVRYARPARDELVARADNLGGTARRLWYVSDRAGSILAIIDDDGAAVKRVKDGGYKAENTWYADDQTHSGYVKNADGTWVASTWSQTTAQMEAVKADRWMSAGRERDVKTNLQYTGLRFYDEEAGRFLSEDANGLAGTNLYRYAGNNPKNKEAVRTRTDWFKATSEWFSTTGIRAAALVLLTAGVGSVLVGAGIGVWGTAAVGAGLNTSLYVGMSLASGETVTAGGLLGAFVGGAVGGLAGMGAGAALFRSKQIFLGSVVSGLAGGAAAGLSTSLVQQYVDRGSVNVGEAAAAAAWGGIGGAIGGAVFAGLGKTLGLLGERAMSCNLGLGQILKYTAGNAFAGAVGGALTDISLQLLQTGRVEARKWLSAAAAGAVGGAAGYLAMRALYKACFVAGTPLMETETSSKPVEEYKSYEEFGAKKRGQEPFHKAICNILII